MSKTRPDGMWMSDPAFDRVVLCVHGVGGSKEDALPFSARAAAHHWQTVSVDLPASMEPWDCVPFLDDVYQGMSKQWHKVAVRATSLGAWLSATALAERPLAGAMFQSPVLDMVAMIEAMMSAVGVDRSQLEAAGELPGPDGSTLSWRYLTWAEAHRVSSWKTPTTIIAGDHDEIVPASTVEDFASRFGADVTWVPGGAHWLRTLGDRGAISAWEDKTLAAWA